jgi:hypothetical protein
MRNFASSIRAGQTVNRRLTCANSSRARSTVVHDHPEMTDSLGTLGHVRARKGTKRLVPLVDEVVANSLALEVGWRWRRRGGRAARAGRASPGRSCRPPRPATRRGGRRNGNLETVVARVGIKLAHLDERQVGPLAGELADRSCHLLSLLSVRGRLWRCHGGRPCPRSARRRRARGPRVPPSLRGVGARPRTGCGTRGRRPAR